MTLRLILLATIALNVIACSSEPAPTPPSSAPVEKSVSITPKVIYGTDNRMDFYQASEAWKTLAASTAALVRSNRVTARPRSEFELHVSSYASDYNLCEDEPFYDQATLAFCSGFFVGGDYMVTAGHCIRTQSDCDNTTFVFNYALKEAGVLPTRLPSSDIFRCRKLIKSQMGANGADFAVIELDRDVADRQPLRLRTSGSAAPGNELVVIGHPAGLPTKVAGQGIVRSVAEGYMVASLDTYGGNSGSAVFNATTGEVEGILVRGEMDFKYRGQCRVSNVCDQGACRGEDVTRIMHALPFLPQ